MLEIHMNGFFICRNKSDYNLMTKQKWYINIKNNIENNGIKENNDIESFIPNVLIALDGLEKHYSNDRNYFIDDGGYEVIIYDLELMKEFIKKLSIRKNEKDIILIRTEDNLNIPFENICHNVIETLKEIDLCNIKGENFCNNLKKKLNGLESDIGYKKINGIRYDFKLYNFYILSNNEFGIGYSIIK